MSIKVDREALHQYLFEHADAKGVINVAQGAMAEDLGVERARLNEILKQFCQDGRMKHLTRHGGYVTYVVYDPQKWREGDTEPPPTKSRKPLWG